MNHTLLEVLSVWWIVVVIDLSVAWFLLRMTKDKKQVYLFLKGATKTMKNTLTIEHSNSLSERLKNKRHIHQIRQENKLIVNKLENQIQHNLDTLRKIRGG